MSYNLLEEKWLTARTRSGKLVPFSVREMTGIDGDDAFVEIFSHRGDFRAAKYQFLIGLLQTTMPPRNEIEWRKRYEKPPTPGELADAVEPIKHAFDLKHAAHPFMQESYLGREGIDEKVVIKNISAFRVESPGEDTADKNKDFLEKARNDAFCASCTASALITLQKNAPSGGRGQMTSVRGGGPLTTLLIGETLWETLWLNVLPQDAWGDPAEPPSARTFPWLAEWPIPKAQRGLTRADVHAAHNFWGAPRRVMIRWDDQAGTTCTSCGTQVDSVATEFQARPDGFQYSGSWDHPLTPWRVTKEAEAITLKGEASPTAYRNWRALIANHDSLVTRPAKVVSRFRKRHQARGMTTRLWAGGFDTDNAKVNGWYEGVMPVPSVEPEHLEAFDAHVVRLIEAADWAAKILRTAVQKAWDLRSTVLGTRDPSVAFWHATESEFYDTITQLAQIVETQGEARPVMEAWHSTIRRTAIDQFDVTAKGRSVGDGDPGNVARARLELIKTIGGKKMKEMLSIHDAGGDP